MDMCSIIVMLTVVLVLAYSSVDILYNDLRCGMPNIFTYIMLLTFYINAF